MNTTPLYAPDGMANFGSGSTVRFRDDGIVQTHGDGIVQAHGDGIVQAHERHDDGLVHNHDWAATEKQPAGARQGRTVGMGYFGGAAMAAPSGTPSATAARSHDQGKVKAHERHDDGLVHNHQWAVTGM